MVAQSCAKVLGRTDASIFVDRAEEERCTSDRMDRPRFARLRGCRYRGERTCFARDRNYGLKRPSVGWRDPCSLSQITFLRQNAPLGRAGHEWRGEPSDPSARAYGRRAEALAKEGYGLRRAPHSYEDAPRGSAGGFT
jgi:hypothetical protein